MRTLDRSLGALLLSVGLVSPAFAADGGAAWDVERSAEAADCPDANGLAARVAEVRGHAASPADGSYRVEFERSGARFRATIRAADGSSRVIDSQAEGCGSLAQATAVTLALLLDAAPHTASSSALPAPAAPSPPPRPAPRRAQQSSPETRVRLALGGGALFGVVSSVAPALHGEGGLQRGRFRAGLGALWTFPRTLTLGPGTVRESLLAGTARACFALAESQARVGRLRLDGCSGLHVGAQRAQASGYTSNASRTRNWLALPAELGLSESFGSVGVELSAAALFPLVRNEFAVDGQGPAYTAASVSAWLALRVFVALPW